MNKNKDQGGAAVRGEAVAMTDYEMDTVMAEWVRTSNSCITLCRMIEAAVLRKLSARAADAPSEPSELRKAKTYEEGRIDGERSGRAVIDIHNDQMAMNCHYRERVFNEIIALDTAEGLSRFARVKSRAADALDSQPTDDKRDDLIARLRHQVGELNGRLFDLQTAGQSTIRPTTKQLIAQLHDNQKWTIAEQNAVAEFLTRFPNESSQGMISLGDAWKHGQAYERALASSQPTDGGVRN